MKFAAPLALLGATLLLAAGLALQDSALAQPSSGQSASSAKEPTKSAKAGPSGRLPNNYGKLGLSDDQKRRIYAIQNHHQARIDELEQQLAAVRGRRDEEIHGVLTSRQRKQLSDLLEEAAEKRAAAKSETAE